MKEPPRRQYISTVIVEFDHAFDSIVEPFSAISKIYSDAINEQYGLDRKSQLARLTFNCDPLKLLPNSVNTDFAIERRVQAPYEKNRYFSQGPVPTSKLISLLERVETVLTKN